MASDQRTAGSTRRAPDLGMPDSLVQLSFLIQEVLGSVVGAYGLSIVQARLLGVLRGREPGMAQLARVLNLDKSSTTGLVSRAERRGLLRRMPVPSDGRAVHVVLTEAGRDLAQTVAAEVERQLTEATAGLTQENRRRLSLLASRIVLDGAAQRGLDDSTSPFAIRGGPIS
jgi:DNA-binding MarR family transcriptional regulator